MTPTFRQTALIISALSTFFHGAAIAGELPKKGTTTYVVDYVFHPTGYNEVPGVGRVVMLLLYGKSSNTKGEAAFDKMNVKCFGMKVEAQVEPYFDGACSMIDPEGDMVFSSFDSRKRDQSQPEMDCGTHTILGGTGKYAGITGTEPFACEFAKENPIGGPFADYRVKTPHVATWEIK